MKKSIFLILMLVCLSHSRAEAFPWPSATSEALYLPFGLQWFMEMDTVKKTIRGYGEADCHGQFCRWMADVKEGTVIFQLFFHCHTLVGFQLDYTVRREAETNFLPKLEKLKESLQEWQIRKTKPSLPPATTPADEYSAENKDSKITVKWRESEYSLFIRIEMKAK